MNYAPRILFLFTNPRDELISRVRLGQDADTALRGLNRIAEAEHLAVTPQSLQALRYIPRLLRYDCIIAQDNFLLGYVISLCARLLPRKTKWFYVAIHSSTLIRRHSAHPIRLFLLRLFWKSYSRIICISEEQRSDFLRMGIPPTHLVFVPFGVDAAFFHPTDEALEEDLIVSVGRDTGRDYETLFAAAKLVGCPFVVVASPKNIPPTMSVPANVSVRYDRSLSEVRDLYARARLVAVASKDASVADGSDCSGQTVILDALAAGKAVVATERPWMRDYLVSGKDLVIVPPHDPEALAKAITALYGDASERKHLAANGRATVALRYTTEAFARALKTLIGGGEPGS